jgi:hypothetical protein
MWLPVVKKTLWLVVFLVGFIITVASLWFVFHQLEFFLHQPPGTSNSNVQITAFSVDPEGWKSTGGLGYSCPFDITFQNTGTSDVKLWLEITMYRLGEIVGAGKQGVPLMVSRELHGFTLSAGEVRSFQEVMYWVPYTANTGEGHPFGATYMAGIKLENSIYTSDTATVTEPFSTFLVVTAIIVAVIAIAILIYCEKRKH